MNWLDVRRRVGIVYAMLMALLAFVAVVLQVLVGREVWMPPAWLLAAPVLAIGVDTLQRSLRDAWRRRQRPRTDEAYGNIRRSAEMAMVRVSEIVKLPVQRMGVSVFVVRRHPLTRRPHLARILRSRVGLGVPRSDIRFSRGKGVIGKVWAEKRSAYCHWQPIAQRYEDIDLLDDAEWAKVPDADRWGFSQEDFVAIVRKYAEIQAVPLVDRRGTFLGCVALDREVGSNTRQLLNSTAVLSILTEAAGFIGPEVEGL